MRMLIVEDNEETVRGIFDYAEDNGWECRSCDFENAKENIALFDPEIVIMDWMYDAEDIDRGKPIFEDIYNNEFRPVIIFSAVAKTIELPENIVNTPLIEIVQKGDEQVVIDRVEEWKPYISAVRNLKAELNNSLLTSVQAIDNFMKMPEYPGDDVVKYMLNKRTTFYFNKNFIASEPPAWIQYDYPPVQDNLLVADVLRRYSESTDIHTPGDPREYCVILTPSCDMAWGKAGQIILIASCQPANTFSNDARLAKGESLEDKKGKEKKEKLISSLHTGYNYAKVALPELPNKIPYMTIDLKKIEQISLAEIATSEKVIDQNTKFYRVASMNSPFREQIVWAHMINSCRPGMPDRDMNTWAEGILLQ